uniref:Uncharacterized protein n=1 Tax=Sphaeramia orbicularis TaxID=375764 RepID=A0A673BUL7_9TELE
MGDRSKIHVFLGAPPPPPSSSPDSVSEADIQGEDSLPTGWRRIELTWMDGRLQPAAEAERQVSDRHTNRTTVGLPGLDLHTNPHQKDLSSEADLTSEVSQRPAGSGCNFKNKTEESRCGTHRPVECHLSQNRESNSEMEDECSASIQEYLDSCFPAAQPNVEPPHVSSAVTPPVSVHTQYLTTWTLSQALILKGRRDVQSATSPQKTQQTHPQTPPSASSSTPELFSPATPSPVASAELFSQPWNTPRVEEGGIVLETTIGGGLLCSQETEQQETLTAKSPDCKRSRLSEESRTEAPVNKDRLTEPRRPTTLLVQCDKSGVRYSILVAVVHPCHLREVKVRSGPSAGTLVPLASIIVTDQSCIDMKVVFWRRAAFWALTVRPGDILLITGLQVHEDRWRGETVLQSTYCSKLLNLGQVTTSTSPAVYQQVNAHSLSSLCAFLRERRPLLVSLSRHPPQNVSRLAYTTLRSLRANTLVHALLRVTHTHISTAWHSQAESHHRSAAQLQAIVTVEQPGGQQGALLLWGAAVDWLPRLSANRATVWDFRVLLVREGLTSDLPELHSTPWSSVQPLDPADPRMQAFLLPRLTQRGNSSSLELDLETLLSQKYSGEVELRVQVNAFHFQDVLLSQNAPQPVLDSSTPLADILAALGADVSYTGCGRCAAELDTDANGIYSPCYPCLPHTSVRRYYRPGVLTVSGRNNSQVCVQVPPVQMQKILNAPPDKLHKAQVRLKTDDRVIKPERENERENSHKAKTRQSFLRYITLTFTGRHPVRTESAFGDSLKH